MSNEQKAAMWRAWDVCEMLSLTMRNICDRETTPEMEVVRESLQAAYKVSHDLYWRRRLTAPRQPEPGEA